MTQAGRPRRVRVVGSCGAGKSTLARRLGPRLGVPVLEVDGVVHLPGWCTATQQELDAALEAFRRAPDSRAGWVVDGNYATRLDAERDDVDTVVWLDYPRWLVMGRLLRRTAVRLALRRRLWNGNRERWRRLVTRDPMRNIVLWTWTEHAGYRRRYGELAAADGGRRWVRLRSPREARRWLRSVQPSATRRSGATDAGS